MICILGNNAFSYYLAAALQKNGHNVIMLSKNFKETSIEKLIIKEDGRFIKEEFSIQTANNYIKDIDFLIITAPINELKTSLLNISPKQLIDTKTICFSGIKSTSLIKEFLQTNSETAYYQDNLTKKGNTISSIGTKPQVLLPKDTSKPFIDLFSKTEIATITKLSKTELFKKWFAPFAINFLLNSLYNKSCFELSKNKDYRILIETLSAEIIEALDPKEKVIKKTELISDISAISNQRIYKLSYAELNFINATLCSYKTPKNEFNKLIKTIYNKISL